MTTPVFPHSSHLDDMEIPAYLPRFKVVLFGSEGVGKRALVERLMPPSQVIYPLTIDGISLELNIEIVS
ncbi:hypothetical protein EMCRGX_G033127 [Ephydatia muelleri]